MVLGPAAGLYYVGRHAVVIYYIRRPLFVFYIIIRMKTSGELDFSMSPRQLFFLNYTHHILLCIPIIRHIGTAPGIILLCNNFYKKKKLYIEGK